MAYTITVNILPSASTLYVIQDAENPTSIEESGSATLNFIADGTYYILQSASSSITVTGAELTSWTRTSTKAGALVISNPTGAVTVTLTAKQNIIPQAVTKPFNVSAKAPVDTRLVLTKYQMAALSKAKMPENYLCICKDDGKLYIWNTAFSQSATLGYFKSYEEVMNLADAINKAVESPTTKAALEEAVAETLPGALSEAMNPTDPSKESKADEICSALFSSEHFDTTLDNKIDLAISIIEAIDGN